MGDQRTILLITGISNIATIRNSVTEGHMKDAFLGTGRTRLMIGVFNPRELGEAPLLAKGVSHVTFISAEGPCLGAASIRHPNTAVVITFEERCS